MEFSYIIIASLEVLSKSVRDWTLKDLLRHMLWFKQIEEKLNSQLKYIKTMGEDEFHNFQDLVKEHSILKELIISLYERAYEQGLISRRLKIENGDKIIDKYICALIMNCIKDVNVLPIFFARLNEKLGKEVFTCNYENFLDFHHKRGSLMDLIDYKNLVLSLKGYFGVMEVYNIAETQSNVDTLHSIDHIIKGINNLTLKSKGYKSSEIPGIFDLYIYMDDNKDIFNYILSGNIGRFTHGEEIAILYGVYQLVWRLQEKELFDKIVLEDHSGFRNLNPYISEIKKVPGAYEKVPDLEIYKEINHIIDKIKTGEIELLDDYRI